MLPPETEAVWEFVKTQPALGGFVLIGGSALALRLGHRRSEDLDLACLERRLPRPHLEALLLLARNHGLRFDRDDDEVTLQYFIQDGLELHDFQQNFVAGGGVKVSFFTADDQLRRVLTAPREATPRVATLEELFNAKCLVSALRSKTRDWLDLYLLMREHGFTIQQFAEAFRRAGAENQCDTALARLCSGIPQKDDEGYAHLLAAPPSLPEITAFFQEQRNRLEIEKASQVKRRGS